MNEQARRHIEAAIRRGMTIAEITKQSGRARSTLVNFLAGSESSADAINDWLNVIGYKLTIVKA